VPITHRLVEQKAKPGCLLYALGPCLGNKS